jgi:predicted nucleic acid-binding protein
MKAADTRRFVLDASIALAWCFDDESTKYTDALLDVLSDGGEAVVPALWAVEVGNGLLVGERRKRINEAQLVAMCRRIADLPIQLEPIRTEHAFGSILPLARREQLSEYDAAYLELAIRETLPLATLDAGLQRAARKTGVALVRV